MKILVYAYLDNVYSSRRIEACLKENIHYMWLSGMSTPDHNTINRFRGERLQELLKQVFSQVVMLLVDHGLVNMKEVYLDGTKVEATASRYSFVWGKSIKTSKKRIENQLEELWKYACGVAREEMKDTEPLHFEQIAPEAVKCAIEKIDQALKEKEVDKKVKQKINLHYSLHQNQADTLTLYPHMEGYKTQYDSFPEVLVADAGYGSEENYEYLEKEQKVEIETGLLAIAHNLAKMVN